MNLYCNVDNFNFPNIVNDIILLNQEWIRRNFGIASRNGFYDELKALAVEENCKCTFGFGANC